MADPVSAIGIGSMAVSAGGGIFSAFGNKAASDAKADAYMYQAGVADVNRRISLENADYARKVGDVEQQQYGMKAAQQRSQILTGQSGRGIDVTQGMPAMVRESQEDISTFDQAMIQHNAARKAYGYEVEASKYAAESEMQKRAAANTKKAGETSMIGSLIGTAGSVASKWLQFSPGSGGGYSGGYEEDNRYA